LLQALAETLKTLVVALSLAARTDGAAGDGTTGDGAAGAVMRLLLPLLVDAAAQLAVPPRAPQLASMAVKLVTHLAGGPHDALFRSTLAEMAPASKLRLQARFFFGGGSVGCIVCWRLGTWRDGQMGGWMDKLYLLV
jgi:hypothetical protein